jgi:putative transposase
MSKQLSAGRVRSTHACVQAHRNHGSVQASCRILVAAPSGYCERLKQPVSNQAQEAARRLRLIRASFMASQSIYGAPRVFLNSREAEDTCGTHHVARLIRESGLRALHGYRTRRCSVGKPSVLLAKLLRRQLTVTRPSKAWVTDVADIRTWQGWLYPAVVMDLFSRKIVGWSVGPTIRRAGRGSRRRSTPRHAARGRRGGTRCLSR